MLDSVLGDVLLGPPPPYDKCAKLKYMYIHKYSSAGTVYWRTQARGKRKNIMRFEIRYFFLEVGLSLIISFHFLTEWWRTHLRTGLMSGPHCPSHLI